MARPSSPHTRRIGLTLAGVLAGVLGWPATPTAAATGSSVATPAVVFAPLAVGYGANSGNWAGWVAASHHTSVSASWIQPSVSCARHETSDSAFWVGLDGYGSPSVEQVGSQAGCSDGSSYYSAWTEFYPAPPSSVNAPVHPGDALHASVTFVSGHTYRLTLSDSTRHWAKTVTGWSGQGTNASVEVVAEAPSDARTGRVLALSRFSATRFTGVAVDKAPLSRLGGRQQLVMGSSKRVMAQSSALDSSTSFAVSWRAQAG